jgi:replicative DNA helicase
MKEIPHSESAEDALLGALLVDGDIIGSIDIQPSDFFGSTNQIIFEAMNNLKGRIGTITVQHELQRTGKLDEVGGESKLIDLFSRCPTSVGFGDYANIIKKCAFNRRTVSVGEQISNIGYKDGAVSDTINDSTGIFKQLVSGAKDDSVISATQAATDGLEFYTNYNIRKPILTGVRPFDDAKSGYIEGEYVMLAGRTGKGKTTLALQQACHIAETKKVLFFSMEMFEDQITNKNVARITGFPEMVVSMRGHYMERVGEGKYIPHKGFTDAQWKSIFSALDKISKLNFVIAEGNRSLDSIRRIVEKQLNSTGCDIVFIDYLGLIREKQGKDGHDRYNFLSEELSRMPKEYRIPFCVLHQMNREAEYRTGESRNPKITDLREGGEESVDLLVMLARCENPNQSELHILKDRLRGDPCIIPVNWYEGRYS